MNLLRMNPVSNGLSTHLSVVALCLLFLSPFLVIAATGNTSTKVEECTTIKGLIVLTQFSDVTHQVRNNFVKRRFFRQLNEYVQDVSYGRFCIGGNITQRRYQLPRPVSRYKIADRNLKVEPQRLESIIVETINTVKRDYNLPEYDFIVLFLEATASEYGMIGLCGYPSHGKEYNERINRLTGYQIKHGSGVAIFSYQAPLGTLFHDIAHILAGRDKDGKRVLPHLYDNTL